MSKQNSSILLKIPAFTIAGICAIGTNFYSPASAQLTSQIQKPILISAMFEPPEGSAPKDAAGAASRGSATFTPPEGSAPKDAAGAASRGNGTFTPPEGSEPKDGASGASRTAPVTIMPIIPKNNYGLTVSERPTFFVYLPKVAIKEVLFSIQDEKYNNHYQTTLKVVNPGGIFSFQLPDNIPPLEIGKNYRWFVVVVKEGENLKADTANVRGWIKRVANNSNMLDKKLERPGLEKAAMYGKAGLWYDTLSTLAEAKITQPKDAIVAQEWQYLLKQAGLQSIANQPIKTLMP